jgi:hypothetical protein
MHSSDQSFFRTFSSPGRGEPTNIAAERALPAAVIWQKNWQKKSFASRSEVGCELAGRLLGMARRVKLCGRVLVYLGYREGLRIFKSFREQPLRKQDPRVWLRREYFLGGEYSMSSVSIGQNTNVTVQQISTPSANVQNRGTVGSTFGENAGHGKSPS